MISVIAKEYPSSNTQKKADEEELQHPTELLDSLHGTASSPLNKSMLQGDTLTKFSMKIGFENGMTYI